jgi:hypothetical protein
MVQRLILSSGGVLLQLLCLTWQLRMRSDMQLGAGAADEEPGLAQVLQAWATNPTAGARPAAHLLVLHQAHPVPNKERLRAVDLKHSLPITGV